MVPMLEILPTRLGYTRGEQLSDAVIHFAGIGAALAAVPALITMAVVWRGDFSSVAAVSIYSFTLVAMLVCSALCNLVTHRKWYRVFRHLDHSAIYFKIAGTYTPFTLLSGTSGYLLTGLWAAALAGTSLKIFGADRFKWVGLALYLGMGWAGLFLGWSMFEALSTPVIALIVSGGLIYTTGVAFFLYERLLYHNTIWHGFVLVATGIFYSAVTLHLIDTSII